MYRNFPPISSSFHSRPSSQLSKLNLKGHLQFLKVLCLFINLLRGSQITPIFWLVFTMSTMTRAANGNWGLNQNLPRRHLLLPMALMNKTLYLDALIWDSGTSTSSLTSCPTPLLGYSEFK